MVGFHFHYLENNMARRWFTTLAGITPAAPGTTGSMGSLGTV